MSLFSQQITPTKYSKSYATEANAIKAADAIIERLQGAPSARTTRRAQYVVTKNEEGRFAPVLIVPSQDCCYYAHNEFATIGV